MTEIRYIAPQTLEEAIGAYAAAAGAARILAGGTDLLVQMRAGVAEPGVIVDIKKIAEMTASSRRRTAASAIGAAVSGMRGFASTPALVRSGRACSRPST
jgi:carbon-monoxide dehydrogenase medium subunit